MRLKAEHVEPDIGWMPGMAISCVLLPAVIWFCQYLGWIRV
jgi:hypothetical protein